ncbi:MAG: methyltransferase domain-containing protein [Gammaproteobacteria bacterium]|nr:class I SAM-dependent methyltransferase [Gammaproteobacteria bacterium]NIP87624.1 class I SAM-dependent methyltransferase [Gammaproteobacteria bacterium]NIR21949.1 class I SAM-dependent methyltransferase [Gammaproteobacteria bacterium]NIS03645.1 class I SAM-dependent methyltransferase [Gammaproteobacteria bacterium]NIU40660.1 methyltransferase domain-containing protein [Gammaproteobacteria bacterium]
MSDRRGTPSDYAPHVRAQYEDYPFPLRDPRDEAKGLIVTEQDSLGKINHYCFGGREAFGNGFRVLVAGGGTGDHTIFLAEQLRGFDAGVTYIDISEASLEIAMERARVRGLDNIEWHHGSILDIGSLGLAPFNLISCTGVLHHLPEPERGLAALRSVLAPDGAMSLMLYGRFGRLSVYAGQELMRLVNRGVDDRAARVRNARAVLESLPQTNWLLRGGDAKEVLSSFLDDESNLYDTLLHEQDRAYSVTEIYEFLAGADLELVEFVSFLSNVPSFRYLYDPMVWITDPALRAHVASLPRAKQQAIAEAINCVITCHSFYAAPSAAGRIAMPNNPEMVPSFLYFDPAALPGLLSETVGRECAINYRHSTVRFVPGRFSADVAAEIDGRRCLGEIVEIVRRRAGGDVTQEGVWHDFMTFYEPLNSLDVMLLRHRAIPPFPEFPLDAFA